MQISFTELINEPNTAKATRSEDQKEQIMNNHFNFLAAVILAAVALGCGWSADNNTDSAVTGNSNLADRNTSPNGKSTQPSVSTKNAFNIKGTIDDAVQEGKVCDTTKTFTVPGTLEFKFKPVDARSGTYTYTGPFNATGEGPYKINDDGTMKVDGTGCILGKCATYSHNWKAEPIDAANCK